MIAHYINTCSARIRAGIGSSDPAVQQAAITAMRGLISAAARGSQAARDVADNYSIYYGRMPSGALVFFPGGRA